VPVDFSAHAINGSRYAFDLARWLPLELHLLHVEAEDEAAAEGTHIQGRLRALVPAALQERVETHVARGDPVLETVNLADSENAMVVVLGTHPKSALRRWFFGAHGHELLHASHCPVWFVPSGVHADVGAVVADPEISSRSG